MFFLCILILVCLSSISAQQYYDPSTCPVNSNHPGSRYSCKSNQSLCSTFFVYRANQHFKTILNISQLLHVDPAELLHMNHVTSGLEILNPGREIVVPIICSCTGEFFQASLRYMVNKSTTLSEVACDVFEGLVKLQTLFEENQSQDNDVKVGTELFVPLKCACPDHSFSTINRIKYLVTYPLMEGDNLDMLMRKFNTSPVDLWAANHFEPSQTIFANTSLLIPFKGRPVLNLSISNSPPPDPHFLPTIAFEGSTNSKLKDLYIVVSVAGFVLLVAALVAAGLYVKAIFTAKFEKLQSFNARSSPLSCSMTARSSPRSGQTGKSSATSCLSPDILIGIKYSLKNYSIEDIRRATKDFSKQNMIGDQSYKGLIDNSEIMMIKQMRWEDARQVIDVHSKINHINILNLIGVCYGDQDDNSWSYLVIELPSNGCLRDCLSNPSNALYWHRRMMIAFDIVTGLHYLHYCIFPSYAHMNIDSRNIFVTADFRAKLTNISSSSRCSKGNDIVENIERWVAPEYSANGSASEKVDIFAFGVVLLELISGRADNDNGRSFKESIGFLGGGSGSERGCFEQLKCFMDPCLKNDYPLAEALCLAVLAKACVEDDPLHRPSMDDILKVLVRMI